MWSQRPEHFILEATSKPKDRKKFLVIEVYNVFGFLGVF